LKRQGRLSDSDALRRSREMQFLGNDDEVSEMPQVHT
jgi:hypothetical protein